MSDFFSFMAFMIFVIVSIVLLIAALLFPINAWEEYKCGKYGEVTGRDTKWVFFDECYINTGETWLKKDEYAATIIAREGLKSK